MPELGLEMEDVVPKRDLKRRQEIQDHIVWLDQREERKSKDESDMVMLFERPWHHQI